VAHGPAGKGQGVHAPVRGAVAHGQPGGKKGGQGAQSVSRL